MGNEMDWGTPEYSAPFTLMVKALHIKYRDWEGEELGKRDGSVHAPFRFNRPYA